ncbi:MAG TPA: hypothetical protein VEL76_24465 [Gemmataceae bacterium]|nr:hypothetical protein [Gemmataceae bacterium]
MRLSEQEIQRCRALVEAAFPRFGHWESVNERNASYSGFCVWGQYTLKPEPPSSAPSFFVTFDTYKEEWRGHLTVGKHCYFWSSADVGDAHLLATAPCVTLDEAITALKRRIAVLVAALLGSDG